MTYRIVPNQLEEQNIVRKLHHFPINHINQLSFTVSCIKYNFGQCQSDRMKLYVYIVNAMWEVIVTKSTSFVTKLLVSNSYPI